MKTPVDYTKNLKQGIVTMDMLGRCAYSVNKRAKNKRDNIRELRGRKRQYGRNPTFCDCLNRSIGDNYKKMSEYYSIKDFYLSLLSPIAIHRFHSARYDWHTDNEIEEDLYSLYYKVGDYSFHHPIDESEVELYALPIEDLDECFETLGCNIDDLISVQFCKRVRDGLRNNTLKLVA